MNEKEVVKKSKFLSLILRHKPEEIGLILDEHGWADINELIDKAQKKGTKINLEEIKYIVENNDKKRFTFNDDFSKIRANQGHSIEVDLELQETEPPEFLFHGTAEKSIEGILKSGIKTMQRNHVHLSKDNETAEKVGQRHGKPVILKIKSGEMYKDGLKFYISKNGVWLTEYIDPKYIIKS